MDPHIYCLHRITVLAAAANVFSATLDFIRYKQILIDIAKVGVSESWLTTLGILKAAGVLGLLVGIRVPLLGIAAAIVIQRVTGGMFKAILPTCSPQVMQALRLPVGP